MTPKEKAKELSMKFDKHGETDNAIKCDLLCVDEIIKENHKLDNYKAEFTKHLNDRLDYWIEVKQEIENL